jgi:hypothetical protein
MLVLPFIFGVMALDPFTNRRNGKKTEVKKGVISRGTIVTAFARADLLSQ